MIPYWNEPIESNWIMQTAINPSLKIYSEDDFIYAMMNEHYELPELKIEDLYFIFYNHTKHINDLFCFKILMYTDEFIFGPHLIEWGGKIFWVSSLSTLKRSFFGILDRLSLNKALYVIIHGYKYSIQLSAIEKYLPTKEYTIEYPIYIYYSPEKFKIKFKTKKEDTAWCHLIKAKMLAEEHWPRLLKISNINPSI